MREQGSTSAPSAPAPRWTRSVLVGAIYLFAIWAVWTVVVGHRAQQGVSDRASWARELTTLQRDVAELRSGATPVDDALQIEAIQHTVQAALPRIVTGLGDPPGVEPILAQAHLDEVRAGLIAAVADPKNPEPGLAQLSLGLERLTTAVRQQNSALSSQLGTLWNGLNVLVLGALVFAYVTLSLHRQSLAQQESLAALHAALEAELSQREADLRALEAARDRWDRVSRALGDGVWEWWPPDRLSVTARFLHMLGEPESATLPSAAAWIERLHPDDQEPFSAAFGAHVDGFTPALDIECRIRHADGRWRWIYCRALAERAENGEATHMIGAMTDITALREGAAAQERVAAIEHVTAVVGIGVLSLRRDHELISVSEAMHPHARAWSTVANWWKAVYREAGAPDSAPCAECGAQVPEGLSVADLISPFGERRVFALTWTGHDHGLDRDEAPVVVMVKDITEEIELREDDEAARAQLARSEVELRDLLDRIPVGLALLRDDRLEYANAALIALLGGRFSPGLAWQEALPGAPEGAGVMELPRQEGGVAVEVSAPVAVTLDGRPAALRVVRDLSERRRMEAQLRVADRLSSIGAMAAGLSHEINNPLTYVIGNIELIRRVMERADKPVDRAAVAQRVERASEGLERVRSIVNELSTFARSDEADIEPVDINAVIDATLPLVTRMIQPRARLLRERVEVPQAIASRAWAGQIVLNLLLNAAYAIPPGDPERNTVHVRTGVDEQGRVTIEVTDSGGGVPPAHVERIFDPFFTIRSVNEGSGLGLFVCQSLCTRMGGAVELVETGPGGTRMRASLPSAASAPAVAVAPALGSAERVRGRVLVIDDEPDVTDIIAQFLQRHEVEVCHKGREATQAALRSDWDIVLCDLMIPDRNGMEIYEAVRARRPEIAERFTFITGGVLNADVSRFLRETHRPHWIKPLDFGVVVAEVDEAVHAARKAS